MNTLRNPSEDRIKTLLARLRTRQLDRALHGDVGASARYADRASRVRQYGKAVPARG